MSNQNEMSREDYLAYIDQQNGKSAKVKTRLVAPTKHVDTLNAEQYRAGHVDQDEHKIQVQCVNWFDLQYPGLLLFAIPNGGKRGKATASMLKAEGVRRGIPDLELSVVTKDYPGLYIETKTPTGSLKPEQIIAHAYLRAQGYVVAVVRNLEDFQSVVNEYLHGY